MTLLVTLKLGAWVLQAGMYNEDDQAEPALAGCWKAFQDIGSIVRTALAFEPG